MQKTDLTTQKCVPCEGGVAPLTRAEAEEMMQDVNPGWKLSDDATSISRSLLFGDFKQAMAFINRLAELAEAEGHHPDFLLHGWNKVDVTMSTHAIGGLSMNDLIMAAKIDPLYIPAASKS